MGTEPAANEIERISATIGRPEVAAKLFRPRVDQETINAVAATILEGLKVIPAHVSVISSFSQLPPDQATSWATQCWINTVTELASFDEEFRASFMAGGGYLPQDAAAVALYRKKLNEHFVSFIWIVGWGAAVGDTSNCFTIRLLCYLGVVRIENIQATKNGKPGGWGLLDATVEGVRKIAGAVGQRVKTIATNDQVEQAFRRRGFVSQALNENVAYTAKARPLELPIKA